MTPPSGIPTNNSETTEATIRLGTYSDAERYNIRHSSTEAQAREEAKKEELTERRHVDGEQ